MKKRYIHTLIVLISFILSVAVHAQVLSYKFDESGNVAKNSGTGGSEYDLQILDKDGVTADLRSEGLNGKALDLSSATGMGKGSGSVDFVGPVATSAKAGNVFRGARSFTIAGWYKTSEANGSGGRLLDAKGFRIMYDGIWTVQIGNESIASDGKQRNVAVSSSGTSLRYNTVNKWIFLAISYVYFVDKNQSIVTFYVGDSDLNSSLASNTITCTLAEPVLNCDSNLVFGNNATKGNRPFKGSWDNITVYATQDTTGALDAAAINNLRLAQINER